MECGLIARPAQSHCGADEQREEAHRSEHEIHRALLRRRRERHVEALARAQAQQRVRESRPFVAATLVLHHVAGRLHGRSIHGQQNVAALNAGRLGRRSRRDLRSRDTFGARRPEDAVLHLVPPGVRRDIRYTEHHEHGDDEDSENGPAPRGPAPLGRLRAPR